MWTLIFLLTLGLRPDRLIQFIFCRSTNNLNISKSWLYSMAAANLIAFGFMMPVLWELRLRNDFFNLSRDRLPNLLKTNECSDEHMQVSQEQTTIALRESQA